MTVRQAEWLAQELDKDALGMVMKDRGDKINAAMQKKDARRVLELGAELVTLAQADDMPEKEIQKIEDELMKFIKKVAPDLVDEDDDEDEEEDDEDEDDEPPKKKPGKKSKKRRDRGDEDEDIERNPITGIRTNKDLDREDLDLDTAREDDEDDSRDALGRKLDKDL